MLANLPVERAHPARSKVFLCAAAAWVVSTSGCVDSPPYADDEAAPAALQAPAAAPKVLRNPEGVYFAEVTANGTGCPAGTWNTSLAPDGQTFTTTFSAYEAIVGLTNTVSVKDCVLTVKLHSPQGLSYSVSSFYYSGYAYLERGVSGRQFANYYFQGNPVENDELRTDLVGPYDDTFLFKDEVGIVDFVPWSPCGVVRDLNVVTRLRVLNGNPPATGYMNIGAVDGSNKLEFRLAWRKCEVDAGAPVDAGTPRDAGRADAGAPVDAGPADAGRRRPRWPNR